jgi:hypothetical protein
MGGAVMNSTKLGKRLGKLRRRFEKASTALRVLHTKITKAERQFQLALDSNRVAAGKR